MPFENIRNIIDQAYMLGTEIIYVCGEGEPLLHPKILEVLTYIGKYDFKIIILTNASIFRATSRILELPRSLKLSFVVNLSAADSKKFASIYGKKPSVFVELLENIKNINKRHPVLLSYLIFKDTYQDLFKFIKLAHSMNITMIRLKFPILYNVKQREMLLSDKEMNILLHSLMELKGFSEKYGINVEFKKYIINYYLEKAKKAKVDKCYNGWFFAKINVNGDIYLCCKENKFLGRASSGNFKEVFFSPAYVAYVLQGKRGINIHSKDWKKCRFCLECERNVSLSRILK
jgi:MoaA/NifB/PqqE/SkfB family radical SAM enzyme